MKDLGEAKVILGMQITTKQEPSSIVLLRVHIFRKGWRIQHEYEQGGFNSLKARLEAILDKKLHEIINIPYASAIGSIMYFMGCCTHDLTYAMRVSWLKPNHLNTLAFYKLWSIFLVRECISRGGLVLFNSSPSPLGIIVYRKIPSLYVWVHPCNVITCI